MVHCESKQSRARCASPGEILVRVEEFPHSHESTHDFDVDGNGAFAGEDRGEHGHTLLSDLVRRVAATAPPGKTKPPHTNYGRISFKPLAPSAHACSSPIPLANTGTGSE
jgi:hypothetical protein